MVMIENRRILTKGRIYFVVLLRWRSGTGEEKAGDAMKAASATTAKAL